MAEQRINDRGDRIEYSAKDVRLIDGAGMFNRTPQIQEHFTDAMAIDTKAIFDQLETGTGTSHAVFVNSTSIAGGAMVGIAGATTDNTQEVAGKQVIWQPSTQATANSPLVLEVRAKFVGATTATDGDFVIGFADAVTYTSGLAFVVGLSSLYTTDAPVEFAGFHYSSIPTSGTLFAASANFIGIKTTKNSVGALAKSSAVAKDSNFHIYRVSLDASTNATFFIDDSLVGYVAAATTAATALTPYIAVVGKNSHANTATVDYVIVKGGLV